MQHFTFAACSAFAVMGFLAAGSPSLTGQGADAHVGTWTQNFAKSKYDPAPSGPAPQSVTRTYEMFGDGLKYTAVTIAASERRATTSYSAHFDGKNYPVIGSTAYDSIALKRIDAYAFESTLRKKGKVVATVSNVVSADGQTMTVTSKTTTATGQPARSVTVFEKQ